MGIKIWSVYSFGYSGILMLICGAIAIIGARSVTTLVWAIVLIIVGLIGGGLGGLLVLLGRNNWADCSFTPSQIMTCGKLQVSNFFPVQEFFAMPLAQVKSYCQHVNRIYF